MPLGIRRRSKHEQGLLVCCPVSGQFVGRGWSGGGWGRTVCSRPVWEPSQTPDTATVTRDLVSFIG